MTIGSLYRAVWHLIKANPAAIAIWSLVHLTIGVAARWGMAPFYAAQAANAEAQAHGLPPSFPPVGRFLIVWLILMVILAVLYNAVFRAVISPDERRAAYLRLGMDEMRLIGLILIVGIAFFVAAIGLGLLVGIGGGLLAVAIGSGKAAAGVIAVGAMILIWAAMLFVSVRLVVMAPLTLYRRKIMIGPAWRLTKGHFWRLLGALLLAAIVTFVVMLIILLPTMGPLLSAATHPGDALAHQQLAVLQAQQMSLSVTPMLVAQLIISALFGGIMLAIFGGMPPVAMLQLLDQKAGLGWRDPS